MVAVMSSQGSRRQIRQCKRYDVTLPAVLAAVASSVEVGTRASRVRGPVMSRDSRDDEDGSRRGVRPDEGEPALVATNTARFSRI